MGSKTGIQWTARINADGTTSPGRTWNPWQGCAKVSPGCANCYMFRDKKRYGQDPETVVRSQPPTFNAPLAWEREAAAAGRTDRVFTCSWSDWFIRDADPWRDEAWSIIKRTPHLTYQILTKRHGRIAKRLPSDWGDGYPNVWLGVSVENQETAEQRIPALLAVPAVVRFLSIEPMLGPVLLPVQCGLRACDRCHTIHMIGGPLAGARCRGDAPENRGCVGTVRRGIDWVIYGGESGGGEARATDPAWIQDGVDHCREYGIAAFVKQMGSPWAREHKARDAHGGDPSEWPEALRVRQFPEVQHGEA